MTTETKMAYWLNGTAYCVACVECSTPCMGEEDKAKANMDEGVGRCGCCGKMFAKGDIDQSKPVLYRYDDDSSAVRNATAEELAASKAAAESDGGAGVIVVDGVDCYVRE